jgi:hypothetical protein
MAMQSTKDKAKAKRKKADMAKAAKSSPNSGGGKAYLKVPAGHPEFGFTKEGIVYLKVLDYKIKGNCNDDGDDGFFCPWRCIKIHKFPMPSGGTDKHACNSSFRKKCLVEDWIKHDNSRWKDFHARDQMLLNVVETDSDGKPLDKDQRAAKKSSIFDIFYWNQGTGFGEMLKAEVGRDEDNHNFSSPSAEDGGLLLKCKVKKQPPPPGGKKDWFKCTDLELVKADHPDFSSWETACLDECLVQTPDEAMEALLTGGADEDEDEDKDGDGSDLEPSNNGKKPSASKDDDEDEPLEDDSDLEPAFKRGDQVTYEGDEYEVTKVNKDGTLDLEGDDGETQEDVDADDVAAKKKPGKKPAATVDDEDEDEDPDDEDSSDTEDDDDDEGDSDLEDDEDEDDPPPPKKPGKKPKKPADDDDD